jgi:cytoplasmic iron level regulating protein YaaA (DUF328/UPF0246 family)
MANYATADQGSEDFWDSIQDDAQLFDECCWTRLLRLAGETDTIAVTDFGSVRKLQGWRTAAVGIASQLWMMGVDRDVALESVGLTDIAQAQAQRTSEKPATPAPAPGASTTTATTPMDAGQVQTVIDILTSVASGLVDKAAAKALKLGPKSTDELANNVFRDAELMPAIERYTGVLYSATGAADWTPNQRDWAATHVFIHSALFGIVSSADPIPAYRLSYDTKVGGRALKDFWGEHVQDALREMAAGDWILDCRSAGYRALSPIPSEVPSAYLDVVSANGGKSLNHFNKVHKGELVAALVADSPDVASPDDFVNWAGGFGMRMTVDDGTIRLVV